MKSINLILIIFAASLLMYTCKQNYAQQANTGQANEEKIQAVKVKKLDTIKAAIPIEASGMLASEAEMNLSFKIGGIINQLYVKEGQTVRKGQLLASLRTTEIDAQVLKAQQAVDKAKRDVARIEKMYADTAATLEQKENLQTLLEVAQADLQIAEFNQAYAKIVAPETGRILKQFAESNELISPGLPVFRLASNQGKAFILKIGVADKDVIRLKHGDKATVTFDAYPTEKFKAYVSEIAEAADPRTGTFEIELSVHADKKILKNGFIGKVKVFPSQQAPYYKIDMDALVEGNDTKANIFISSEDFQHAQKLAVTPLYIGRDFFTVSPDQLPQNAQVITEGAAYLKDGSKIRLVEQASSESYKPQASSH